MGLYENAMDYFENEVYLNDAWVATEAAGQRRALKNAENMLYRFYTSYNPTDNPLPEKAVFEQAYWILLIDETIQKASLGVTQVSISGISISVNSKSYPISPEAKLIILNETGHTGGVKLGRYRL